MNSLRQDPYEVVGQLRAGAEHALAMVRNLSPETPGACARAEALAYAFDGLHRHAAQLAHLSTSARITPREVLHVTQASREATR